MTTFWANTHFANSSTRFPWRLEYFPTRGFVALATRDFAAGDEICTESPLFWIRSHSPTREEILVELESLSSEERAAFYDLSNTSSCAEREVGIFTSNAFDMTHSKYGEEVSGLYCAIARLNHSCTPNVQQTHYPDSDKEYLHATRDILAGEELNDCYIHLLQPRHSRREELLRLYGFECECSACSLPSLEEIREDDRKRVRARELEDLVVELASECKLADAIDVNESLLRLLLSKAAYGWSERFQAAAYMSSYMLHSSCGANKKAKEHLRRAVELNSRYEGINSQQTQKYRTLLDSLVVYDVECKS